MEILRRESNARIDGLNGIPACPSVRTVRRAVHVPEELRPARLNVGAAWKRLLACVRFVPCPLPERNHQRSAR